MISKQFNLSSSESFIDAFSYFNKLKEKGATIEINEVKQTRSNLQNRSLHLYFTFCADALNNAGIEFSYRGINRMEFEIPWNGDLFKNMVWKPIQITLFEFESTTKLKTAEINQILDVLSRHFACMGLSVTFPNNFDLWIKQTQKGVL
jgi:hypothetical protein